MKSFIVGTVFGIFVSSVGISGVAHVLDKGVETVKIQSQELAK